jgi:hypothetical protein
VSSGPASFRAEAITPASTALFDVETLHPARCFGLSASHRYLGGLRSKEGITCQTTEGEGHLGVKLVSWEPRRLCLLPLSAFCPECSLERFRRPTSPSAPTLGWSSCSSPSHPVMEISSAPYYFSHHRHRGTFSWVVFRAGRAIKKCYLHFPPASQSPHSVERWPLLSDPRLFLYEDTPSRNLVVSSEDRSSIASF